MVYRDIFDLSRNTSTFLKLQSYLIIDTFLFLIFIYNYNYIQCLIKI
jgi:hypothetical protein